MVRLTLINLIDLNFVLVNFFRNAISFSSSLSSYVCSKVSLYYYLILLKIKIKYQINKVETLKFRLKFRFDIGNFFIKIACGHLLVVVMMKADHNHARIQREKRDVEFLVDLLNKNATVERQAIRLDERYLFFFFLSICC